VKEVPHARVQSEIKENLPVAPPVSPESESATTANRLHEGFEQAPLPMALVSIDGRPIMANGRMRKLVGLDAREIGFVPVSEVTHEHDFPVNLDLFQDLLAGRVSSFRLRKRYVRPDGGSTNATLHVSLARDSRGEPMFAVAVAEPDQESDCALQEGFVETGRTFIHELNNLLTAAVCNLDLASLDTAGTTRISGRLEHALNALTRIMALARDFQKRLHE
jgi:PAS domain S-box-containing protein